MLSSAVTLHECNVRVLHAWFKNTVGRSVMEGPAGLFLRSIPIFVPKQKLCLFPNSSLWLAAACSWSVLQEKMCISPMLNTRLCENCHVNSRGTPESALSVLPKSLPSAVQG